MSTAEGPDAPLDLVFVSDLDPGRSVPHLDGRIQSVDKESLDALLLELAPAAGGIQVRTFRDFRPEHLAEEVALARDLLRVRRLLAGPGGGTDPAALRRALASIEEPPDLAAAIRRALEPVAPAAPPASSRPAAASGTKAEEDPALASLFELVDTGASSSSVSPRPGEAQETLERLIREMLTPGARVEPKLSGRTAAGIVGEIDRAIGDSIRGVRQDPAFRALETAWTGLRFLVRRIDFRSGIKLHVVSSSRERLLRDLETVVAPFAGEREAEGRVVCVVLDYLLGATDGEIEPCDALAEVARIAEWARMPVIASLGPRALGVASLRALAAATAGSTDVAERLEAPDRASWRALRRSDSARWLAVAMGRFLLRYPYGKETDSVQGFSFEEGEAETDDAAGAGRLWGHPSLLLGALVASSFRRTGWGVALTSPMGGCIEDLPVAPLPLRTGETVQVPLEVLLPENRLLELSRAGIIGLACRRNTDQAFVVSAPLVFRSPEDPHRSTLPYALFLAQVAAWAESIRRWIDVGKEPAEIARTFEAGLELLACSPTDRSPAVSVRAEVLEGDALRITVTPAREPLVGLPPVALELPWR